MTSPVEAAYEQGIADFREFNRGVSNPYNPTDQPELFEAWKRGAEYAADPRGSRSAR